MLDKQKLFADVFAPTADDTVLVMIDLPHGAIADTSDWADRRAMAEEWREAFARFPVRVHSLLTYAATGANNGDLPTTGQCDGRDVVIEDVVAQSTIVIAMTRYSATAPLSRWVKKYPTLRVASMPGVLRRMEATALTADYREVARKTHILADLLTRAERADTEFSTGDRFTFDLRDRVGHADDGLCHRGKPFSLINLPSGEAFIVPYEGERAGVPSITGGRIPMDIKGERFALVVQANRIIAVEGDGPHARSFRDHLDVDPARRNIAELGLGCNDKAVVMGAIIEDEKAGMHWAYGRSEHLGGVVGPDAFTAPGHVIHQDVVYAPASAIGITRLSLTFPDGHEETVIENNAYVMPD